MKKTNKNNNHKIFNKNYIKGAISGALALTILCSGVGVAAYSAGADNTAQALGVQTESTVEAVKKASTTKEALKKLSKNETVYVIADASGAAKKIIDVYKRQEFIDCFANNSELKIELSVNYYDAEKQYRKYRKFSLCSVALYAEKVIWNWY